MHDYHRILAVVDFSESGLAAARRALNLARLGRAKLAFLHLIEPDAGLDGGYPPPGRQEARQAFEQAGLRRLAFLAANLAVEEAELLARFGHPGEGFALSIAEWRPDLVVAGDDPGYLGGRHDLLILGLATRGGRMMRLLRTFLVPRHLAAGGA